MTDEGESERACMLIPVTATRGRQKFKMEFDIKRLHRSEKKTHLL